LSKAKNASRLGLKCLPKTNSQHCLFCYNISTKDTIKNKIEKINLDAIENWKVLKISIIDNIYRYLREVDYSTHITLEDIPLKDKGASLKHKTKQAGLTALSAWQP
jgi:hypothetical protein